MLDKKWSTFMGAGLLALALSPAQATVVSQFQYDLQGGWNVDNTSCENGDTAADCVNAGGESSTAGTVDTDTVISWPINGGAGTQQSSLGITHDPSGSPVVDGGSFNAGNAVANGSGSVDVNSAGTITTQVGHDNLPVMGSEDESNLVSTQLLEQLTLTSTEAPGFNLDQPFNFDILFRETPNQGLCETGSGSCDDLFVLLNPGVLDFDFSVDSTAYQAELSVEGLTLTRSDRNGLEAAFPNLSSSVFDQLDMRGITGTDGLAFFTTAENDVNSISTRVTISRVPEPQVIGLLGLGLIGIGVATRRARREPRSGGMVA